MCELSSLLAGTMNELRVMIVTYRWTRILFPSGRVRGGRWLLEAGAKHCTKTVFNFRKSYNSRMHGLTPSLL